MVRFYNKARNTAWSVAGGRFIGIGFFGEFFYFLSRFFGLKGVLISSGCGVGFNPRIFWGVKSRLRPKGLFLSG